MSRENMSGGNGQGRRQTILGAGAGFIAPSLWNAARAQQPVTLTLWSWLPKFQLELDLFEKAHPNIKVNLVNAGQGLPHYLKLRNALKAGTGAPDVAQIEFYMAPSFRLIKALEDLSAYGADSHKDEFIGWTWQQSSDAGHVYSMPWDSGPIAQIYRQDILEKYKIELPKTWDEFATAALKLHRDAPEVFLTDAMFNNGGLVSSLLWQAGWHPFKVDGTNISIALNDAVAKRFATYWQTLIDAGAVETRPGMTTEWYTAYDQGRYAIWIAAAWGPVFLSQFAKTSAGKWRVGPIPQWQAGKTVSANWGGSTLGVMRQGTHKKEAAELVIWLTTNRAAVDMFASEQYLFPTVKAALEGATFADIKTEFYGNQPINRVFVESSRQVDPSFEWSPFHDYVHTQMVNEIAQATNGHGTLVEAFDRLQDNVVKYARSQGFTVKT